MIILIFFIVILCLGVGRRIGHTDGYEKGYKDGVEDNK